MKKYNKNVVTPFLFFLFIFTIPLSGFSQEKIIDSVANKVSTELDQGQHVTLTPCIGRLIQIYDTEWKTSYVEVIEKRKVILKLPYSQKRRRKLQRNTSRKEYIELFSNRLRTIIWYEMLHTGYSKFTRDKITGNLQLI